jgi:crotonobetainyl-CoA:carnitine CoA-transferase CaiB-like acyl-CoA transferase
MSRVFFIKPSTTASSAGIVDPKYPVLSQNMHGVGPLTGFRIIDLSQMVSGPMATQILGDQGADIIKVESLTGAAERGGGRSKISSPMASVVNRNKRSIAVDIKTVEGLEIIKKLVIGADGFIHNFRPGAMERVGLGYEDLKKINESLVYLHITGFGATGPYSKKRVYDPIIQCASGLASIQADENGRPRLFRLIVPDKVTSLTASQALTAGLLKRAKTGKGSYIELSMLDALIQFAWAEGFSRETFQHGMDNTREYVRDMVFETNNGYITAGAVQDKEWVGMCNALGKPEWIADEKFATAAARSENRQLRLDLTESVLKQMSTEEALRKLSEHDVPSGIVNHPRQKVLEDPQVLHNKMLFTYHHPHAAFALLQARAAAKFKDEPFTVRYPAPLLGESTEIILKEIGYTAEQVNKLKKNKIVVSKKPTEFDFEREAQKNPVMRDVSSG